MLIIQLDLTFIVCYSVYITRGYTMAKMIPDSLRVGEEDLRAWFHPEQQVLVMEIQPNVALGIGKSREWFLGVVTILFRRLGWYIYDFAFDAEGKRFCVEFEYSVSFAAARSSP